MTLRPLMLVSLMSLVAGTGCQSFTLEPPSSAVIRADQDNVVDEREIVVLAESQSEANELIWRAKGRSYSLRGRDDLEALGLVQVVLSIPSGRTGGQAIAELERLVPGVTAGVNHAYRPQAAVQPRLYANDLMAWPTSTCAASHPVGVLDSAYGSFESHVVHEQMAAGSAPADSHGADIVQLLSQTAAFEDRGVYLAGVVGSTDDGETAAGVDDILRGIAWLMDHKIRIMNMSLAGPYNKILDRGIQRAADRGVIIVASVGNDGPDAAPRYPAALRDVIAVTAVDPALSVYRNAVQGDHVDVAAPGVEVFIAGETSSYRTGTSYAAPFVATFLAVHDELPAKAQDARNILRSSTKDLGDKGDDPVFGSGLIQAGGVC